MPPTRTSVVARDSRRSAAAFSAASSVSGSLAKGVDGDARERWLRPGRFRRWPSTCPPGSSTAQARPLRRKRSPAHLRNRTRTIGAPARRSPGTSANSSSASKASNSSFRVAFMVIASLRWRRRRTPGRPRSDAVRLALTVFAEHDLPAGVVARAQGRRGDEVAGIGDLRGDIGGDGAAEVAVGLVGVGRGQIVPSRRCSRDRPRWRAGSWRARARCGSLAV